MRNSWLIHDMIRICPQTGNVLETEVVHNLKETPEIESLHLISPRNAYVSFQIIVQLNKGDSKEVDFYPEALRSEEDVISASEYNLFVQWYHWVEGNYVPDGLVPWKSGSTINNPFSMPTKLNAIQDQAYGAIWVDLFVPPDVKPGAYRGTLFVKNGGDNEQHKIELKVLQTVIPNESTITADLNNYADTISAKFTHLNGQEQRYNDGSYFAVEKQFYQLAHEHRALFHNLPYQHSGKMPESFAPTLEWAGKSIRVKDWSLFDEHFGPYLDGSAFKDSKRGEIPIPYMYLPQNFHWPADYAKFGLKGYTTEFKTILQQFYDHFTEKGWLSTKFELFLNHKKRYKLFPYDGDETRFIWDEKINDIFYEMSRDVLERQDGAKFVFRTDSSWCYGLHYKKYADVISLWVVSGLIVNWYDGSVPYLQDHGATVWTYGSAQGLNTNLLGTAITPLVCVARGLNGFDYWNNVEWGKNWAQTPEANGRTTLFYPGDELFGIFGPIPSIRLKVLRNSMQVAECMEQWIKQNGKESRIEMLKLIGSILDGEDTFHSPKPPELINIPPYEWTNQLLSDAAPTAFHLGKSPELFNELKYKLWNLIC